MKRIEDIEKLTAEDLLRIGDDESIPVPEDLGVTLPGRSRSMWGIAAAAAVLIGLGGWALIRPSAAPKDTFDDPYLACAAIEKAFDRMSATVHSTAGKVATAETTFDELTYWK
ncbi:MAG: hypothetical protein IJ795_03115 [Bacteroidales bacterium]|nr:hypothetical protein [Bacteroidales bacterium]